MLFIFIFIERTFNSILIDKEPNLICDKDSISKLQFKTQTSVYLYPPPTPSLLLFQNKLSLPHPIHTTLFI